ncbi:hypothetical protein [Actinoplanes sp. CA-252034]|uniref:hypothetical protein n=1 Tax=Actinoplanes sp. CA-252034 TaxID=3239906 RepID=UPI003D950B55
MTEAAARQVVRAEGGFAYGAVGADIHVFGDGRPLYLLESWRPLRPRTRRSCASCPAGC